jgi:hypothetical protein
MVKTNFTQDGIGRSLSEPFYLPFSRLKKRQVSDGAFALGARLLEERELCRRFTPVRFLLRETLLNLAVAMLINVPVAVAGLLAEKSLARDLTFGAIK